MASAEDYANWIVKNADKKGTPAFDTVAKAYQLARSQPAENLPSAPGFKPEAGNLDGMPAPRPKAVQGLTVAQERGNLPQYDAGEAVSAMGRGAVKALGGLGDIGGSAIGLPTSEEVTQAFGLRQTPAEYAPFEFVGSIAGPQAAGKIGSIVLKAGARGLNVLQDVVNPRLNALATATGKKGPEIVNALRSSTSGVETAGQAAAPAGSVLFSQFTKELEKHAADTAADVARTQDAVLAARANMAEGRMAEGSQKLAGAVAAPNEQEVGQKLISIAEKEKRTMKDTVVNPAFRSAEKLAGNAPIDISNVTSRAAEIMDTVDPSVATALSGRLRKFQGETKTTEQFGPGGARYTTETKIPPSATLAEVGDIRSAINSAAARAKATGDEIAFRDLINLHKELDTAVTTSANLTPEAVGAYKDALRIYAEDYAPRFKTGLQFDLFKVRQGANAIKPENVVEKFFNNPTNTDQFVALYGGNREAMQNAKVGIEGMFRDKVIKDGVIDTKAATKFLDDYSAQIDKLDARGLGIRDKLTSLVDETSRVTAPETRIAEVRKAVKTENLPTGPAKAAAQQQASSLASAATAEDLTALRDAVEIARRRGAYEQLSKTPTKAETGVPIIPSEAPSFLNLPLRISTEVYRRVAGKLNEKMSRQIGELLSDPKRLNEAADMIEKALAMKAKQGSRAAVNINVPSYAGAIPATINALAPPSQNNLAGR